nr:MAG TPA: hypothetical protein [Caudoviricetes sp.]
MNERSFRIYTNGRFILFCRLIIKLLSKYFAGDNNFFIFVLSINKSSLND